MTLTPGPTVARRKVGGRPVIRWFAAAVLGLLVLNVAGIARYPGGPLRDLTDDGILALDIRPADQGYDTIGNDPTPWATVGHRLYFGAIDLVDPWPIDATVDAVTPLELTPGLTVERVLLGILPADAASIGWGDETLLGEAGGAGETFGDALGPLPVTVRPSTSADRATNVLLVLSAAQPGRHGFRGVAVDYRVGPFTFRATAHLALETCIGPFAPGQVCSTGDDEDP